MKSFFFSSPPYSSLWLWVYYTLYNHHPPDLATKTKRGRDTWKYLKYFFFLLEVERLTRVCQFPEKIKMKEKEKLEYILVVTYWHHLHKPGTRAKKKIQNKTKKFEGGKLVAMWSRRYVECRMRRPIHNIHFFSFLNHHIFVIVMLGIINV